MIFLFNIFFEKGGFFDILSGFKKARSITNSSETTLTGERR
jgi:hypothetical protein